MSKGFIVLSVLAAIAAVGCGGGNGKGGVKAPIKVRTENVSGEHAVTNISYVGLIEEAEATAVSFTGMGVVKYVAVSEGQTVSKGQLLAEMDDTQANNILATSKATLDQANDALARYSQLHDSGSLPEAKWVEIQSKVAQARAQYDIAQKNLADCRLTAPCAGIIGKKMIGAGETALPSQAVVTILDIKSVNVNVSIPEAEISSIKENTPSVVKVQAAGNLEVSGGRIEKGVKADALTHTYNVRIKVANTSGRLLPGMVADVKFTGTESCGSDGLHLPVSCIQRKSDGSLFVWVVDPADNAVHRTPVTIGKTSGNRVKIETGLQKGQTVVTEGYQKLSEGTKVSF